MINENQLPRWGKAFTIIGYVFAVMVFPMKWAYPTLFAHVGNFPISFVWIITLIELTRRRWMLLAVALMIYVNFDVELNALPLLTIGTADALDIPMGVIGVLYAYCIMRIRTKMPINENGVR